MAKITVTDYILLPFYLLIIYKTAYYYRDKYYPVNHPWRAYFIPGLTAKIAGALFIGLLYFYYYGDGDTFNYYYHTSLINDTLTQSPGTWFRLITHSANENIYYDATTMSEMFWYDDVPAYTTSCLGAFIGLFCFTKYLVINTIIASISFIGMWLMFITFATQYKNITKYIAIAVLFMPGPVVWGSGLFKDSFCMFAIGCLVYSMHVLFEQRVFKISAVILSVISIILLFLIKAYILVLLPALILKAILNYKKVVAEHPEKKIIFYFIVILFSFITYKASAKALTYLSDFSVDKVLETVKKQKDYLLMVSLASEGSAYDLGDFDPSVQGILKMTVPAINVALFRPYLWEAHSPIQLLSALESAFVLFLTLYLILKRKFLESIKKIYHDPTLIMCLIFTLIFAFLVGVSSYNFGTLSRYKIPCVPFFMVFLAVMIFDRKENKTIEAASIENS
ncbi:hypothetical protein ACFGVR_13510 [Mucilaginibacter sp. AW1-3]